MPGDQCLQGSLPQAHEIFEGNLSLVQTLPCRVKATPQVPSWVLFWFLFFSTKINVKGIPTEHDYTHRGVHRNNYSQS